MCEEKAVERRRRGQAGKAGHALAGRGRQSSSDGGQTDRRCAGADVELAKKDVDLPRVRIVRTDHSRRRRAVNDGSRTLRRTAGPIAAAVGARRRAEISGTRAVDIRRPGIHRAVCVHPSDNARRGRARRHRRPQRGIVAGHYQIPPVLRAGQEPLGRRGAGSDQPSARPRRRHCNGLYESARRRVLVEEDGGPAAAKGGAPVSHTVNDQVASRERTGYERCGEQHKCGSSREGDSA